MEDDKQHIKRITTMMKEQFQGKGFEAILMKLIELQWRIEKLENENGKRTG